MWASSPIQGANAPGRPWVSIRLCAASWVPGTIAATRSATAAPSRSPAASSAWPRASASRASASGTGPAAVAASNCCNTMLTIQLQVWGRRTSPGIKVGDTKRKVMNLNHRS